MMSTCNKCGAKYPSAPVGTIHKCGNCSGGMMFRDATPPDKPVTVTQADRDAAADLLDELGALIDHNGIGQVADLIRDGEYDEHETTLAFARHRATNDATDGLREQGQREGKAAVCHWLRDMSATNPPRSLHHAAATLADLFEQSETPHSAIAKATGDQS